MSKVYPLVPVGEVLTKSEESIDLKPTELYKQVTVKIWGKGVVERSQVTGAEIAASKRFLVRNGQFILSRIDARHGAFGLIPSSLDGAVVTNDFPVFIPNPQRILPQFLDWMSKTKSFVELCKAASEGTTNRVRLKEEKFLSMKIPLPPIEEQRSLVARIEELAGKIEEARSLRRQAAEKVETLIGSTISNLFSKGKQNGWVEGFLGDYVIDDCYGTSEKTTDDELGIPILRMGNIQKGRLSLSDLKYLHLNEKDSEKLILRKGDILVNRTNSAELVGKCAVFGIEGEYAFASYIIRLRLDTERADTRLVAAYINSPAGRAYIFSERKQMTGQANVNAKKVKALPIALPPLPEQRHTVAYLDQLQAKVDAMERLRENAIAELDALLPSILDKVFKGELV